MYLLEMTLEDGFNKEQLITNMNDQMKCDVIRTTNHFSDCRMQRSIMKEKQELIKFSNK